MIAAILYRLRVWASWFLLPFLGPAEIAKLETSGQPTERARERLGFATQPRAAGTLVWFHVASGGDSLPVLALIARMDALLPDARFLITSISATTDTIIASRLPPRTIHQFAPMNAPAPLKRFLSHWRPYAAVFVHGGHDTQILRRTFASGAKMAFVNAGMTDRALATMEIAPEQIFEAVELDPLSAPVPVDADALASLKNALAGQPLWVAASTHDGEEQDVLRAHKTLLQHWPDLCLILAPCDPARGETVRNLIAAEGLSYSRRTRGEALTGQVYLADTQGEMGLWSTLSDIAFLGGSLRPFGGHDPLEITQAGTIILSGNHVANFARTFGELEAVGAALLVADAQDLATKVAALLRDDHRRTKAITAARAFCHARTGKMDDIAERVIRALSLGS